MAAGDGEALTEEEKIEDEKTIKNSLAKVMDAIENNEKTITLSVGQLTTGVTVREWTGVMMLSNIKSPALYFQAAFRAQNPYEFTDKKDEKLYVKENCYIFDFAPERTLIQFDEFANNLRSDSKTSSDRKDNLKELLNFFPVIAEDTEGRMKELDAEEVLKIPSAIKATAVVKSGFMSNFLFKNISGIFKAAPMFEEILNKIKKNNEKTKQTKIDDNLNLDDEGNVKPDYENIINTTNLLGNEKIYQEFLNHNYTDDNKNYKKELANDVKNLVDNMDFSHLKDEYQFGQREIEKNKKELTEAIAKNIEKEQESVLFDVKTQNRMIENT